MRTACEVLAFLVVLIWVLSDRGNHETESVEAIYDLRPKLNTSSKAEPDCPRFRRHVGTSR
jgi:hypothetical protein